MKALVLAAAAAMALAAILATQSAVARAFPSKPIRLIVLQYRPAISKVAATAEFQRTQGARGYSMVSPPDADAFVLEERRRWPSLLAGAGIKPQ
ncbi:MAG: hypothetical protein IT514_11930 [Burkholderiales bacterium]|nr:hypothetical protein [Burkholderiales bacterium]